MLLVGPFKLQISYDSIILINFIQLSLVVCLLLMYQGEIAK